jgi:glycosyltransferase involved in cell wall biosynthesis
MNKIKIGVVIPIGENIQYLKQCLESVINQTHQPDKVILVLDYIDLPAQLMDYVATIPNAQIYNNGRPKGQASARNHGYEIGADLDVILNHDSDDIMLDNRTKIIFDFFTENPLVDLVFTGAIYVDNEGKIIKQKQKEVDEQKNLKILSILAKKNKFIHPTSAIRLEAFKLIGGYDESFPKMIDYNLYLRLALQNRVFSYIPIPTIQYRVHSKQLSHNRNVGRHLITMIKLRTAIAYKLGYKKFSIIYLQLYWYFGKVATELRLRKSVLRKLTKSIKKSYN